MACPICNAPSQAAHHPFCSARCAEVDLGRWLTGRYVVAGEDGDAAEDAPGLEAAHPVEDGGDAHNGEDRF